ARNVIPLRTSAIDNFSKVARIEACVSKSPIGAEPGFQSEAMETQAPASNNFLAGVYCIPKPIDAPGKAVATTLFFAKSLISSSYENSKWSALKTQHSTAT